MCPPTVNCPKILGTIQKIYRCHLPFGLVLPNDRKNIEAAKEYLDHKEYKRRKAKGRDGVVKRMERNAGILAGQ